MVADGAAMCRHGDAVAVDRQDAARCARSGHLAAVEDLHLVALPGGPGARLRIGAADQVVDLVDRLVPLDLGVRLAAPALVGRLAAALRHARRLALDRKSTRLTSRH